MSQGASAGFTMAFVTPIAGTLFPAEEGGLAFAPSRLFMALMGRCTFHSPFRTPPLPPVHACAVPNIVQVRHP